MRTIALLILLASIAPAAPAAGESNLLADPSFEITKDRDQFGHVFAKWDGWKYEGECEFRVGRIAHTGKTSCLLFGGNGAKIRMVQTPELAPGRYRITAFIRGLDIGTGVWNQTTEFMFNEKYIPLNKNGTFGWTKLTYVGELKEKKKTGPSFGLMAPGYLWVDDVSLVKVADDTPLTDKPILDKEESPVAPPGELGNDAVRCPECGYRNALKWGHCYACGTALAAGEATGTGPAVKLITSFEDKNPFDGGKIVAEHATDGAKALRIGKSYVGMSGPQNWTGYDYLKADLYTDSPEPLSLYVEIRDNGTRDYWTRVNYQTIVPPGKSTLIIPTKQLYVGEKSRPGRMLDLAGIKWFVLSIGDKPGAPLFVDNLRLERDDSVKQVQFDGLSAFDFGTATSPVMEGFTQITPGTIYSKGRGYGLKNAKIWRAFDALQPDPLYQDFICIESGGLAVDVPNGKYRVFVNIDNPSGFWGEYQAYRKRAILAQGKPVVTDTMDFDSFRKKYFRFWNVEDLPTDNTFDKYQLTYFKEKMFDVEVTDGQLNIGFQGENWACSVSAVVIFPVAKAAEGEKFLKYVQDKRRFHFDNYFKRILHRPTGDPLSPSADDTTRGYITFQRDCMKDLYYNDTPGKDEPGKPISTQAFVGEYAPLSLALTPLRDLGSVTVTSTDLTGPAGAIPASAIDVGFVSYRLSRVTMEGTVYTIAPRLLMSTNAAPVPAGVTRQFWLTVKVPADAKPGVYKGSITVKPEKGAVARIPVEFRVRAGTLDPVDIPAGPWGYHIGVPWPDDPAAAAFNDEMCTKSLRKMREYGFTTFSGAPSIAYKGFKTGKPVLDFGNSDATMKLAKDLGFLAVVSYGGGVHGFDAYSQDAAAMNAAGFKDYSEFIKAIYTEVQKHADANGWIPVYYNIGDEPIGDALTRAAVNAEAYHKAFPKGPPYFTAASSFRGSKQDDPHFRFSKALQVADWNDHDEESVKLIHDAGGDWAFYNGGNRWTFGHYMYKAAHQFGMKFRLSWHWNATAGDPYYALDCREDDYAWCNSSPDGQLIPSVEFERLREGLGDYRRMLTLARLAKEKAGTPAAEVGERVIAERLAAFKLGQRNHDALFAPADWQEYRGKLDDAIEALRK
ncbi:MAG: glycoside hydrolase domain-containing protein [Tepidisphaeraceae bacterium]